MAAMEFFGWLSFALALVLVLAHRPVSAGAVMQLVPWRIAVLLLGVTALGLAINGTENVEFWPGLGSQRWVFLLLTHCLLLAWLFPTERVLGVLFILGSIIAIYAIFQSFTGIDLLRPGENRAVQPLDVSGDRPYWRSAGLFGSPMHYVYIAGQHLCFAFATLLLWKPLSQVGRSTLVWLAAVAFALIGLSILTTYVRGGWIAAFMSVLVIAFVHDRRMGFSALGLLSAVGATAVLISDAVRLRFLQLFDLGFTSNSDRWVLWQINWQMFLDYPLLGIGYQENELRAKEYVLKLGLPETTFTGHAHNTYLQFLSGTGIVGLTLYLALIIWFLRLTLQTLRTSALTVHERTVLLGALGAQIHVHVGGLTECNFKAGVTNHSVMVVWALVVAVAFRSQLRASRLSTS